MLTIPETVSSTSGSFPPTYLLPLTCLLTYQPQGQGASRPAEAVEEELGGVPNRSQRWRPFQSSLQVILVVVNVIDFIIIVVVVIVIDLIMNRVQVQKETEDGMEDGVCGEVFTTDDHDEGFSDDEDDGIDNGERKLLGVLNIGLNNLDQNDKC